MHSGCYTLYQPLDNSPPSINTMRVAVAGGSGTIGASIITALASSNKKHTPIILSRHNERNHKNTSTASESPATEVTLETRYVDYTSHDSLVSALCDVDAVISALLIPGPELVSYQVNLLHAAEEAGCTRFAPSEFALRKSVHSEVDIDHAKLAVWDAVQESVNKGNIDVALFPCGMFMNYLGIGAPRSTEALAGFREGPHLFHLSDPQGPWIEVPVGEDGLFPSISMTDIRDVGRFVVAALEMEEPWGGRELGMAGDTIGFAELIELCERYLGRAVDVRQVTVSQLERQLQSVDPSDFLARMEIQYSIVCGRGRSVVTPTLNALCPHVQPLSVKEFMEKFWMV